MFGGNIKLDKDLLKRVKKYADVAGYSSAEEFITHALEKELAQLEEADSDETGDAADAVDGDAADAVDGDAADAVDGEAPPAEPEQ